MRQPMSFQASKLIPWGVFGFLLTLISLAFAAPLLGSELLYGFFSPACHQMSDRCYRIAGQPTALCVRCLWIYAGLAVGPIFFTSIGLDERRSVALLLLSIGLMLGDVAMESLGFFHSHSMTRAATGLLFGFASSRFVLIGLTQLCLRNRIKTSTL